MSQAKQFIAPAKKFSVAQTCNQLSSFLKEKGFHLGINAKFDDTVKSPLARMTVDLLSNMENPDQVNAKSEKLADLKSEREKSKSSKTAQMTIFYDGRVIVIDDVSADRARDVMLAAGNCSSSTGKTENRVELALNSTRSSDVREVNQAIRVMRTENRVELASNSARSSDVRELNQSNDSNQAIRVLRTENRVDLASNSARSSDVRDSIQSNQSNDPNQAIRVRVQPNNGLDLPIARRASLHKFLAKRKDRATERAPYQLQNPSPAAGTSSKDEHKFDLNL